MAINPITHFLILKQKLCINAMLHVNSKYSQLMQGVTYEKNQRMRLKITVYVQCTKLFYAQIFNPK